MMKPTITIDIDLKNIDELSYKLNDIISKIEHINMLVNELQYVFGYKETPPVIKCSVDKSGNVTNEII